MRKSSSSLKTFKKLKLRDLNVVARAAREFGERAWLYRYLEQNALEEAERAFLDKKTPIKDKDEGSFYARKLKSKYGSDPIDDFALGMIYGKLSALEWVLSSKWDAFKKKTYIC